MKKVGIIRRYSGKEDMQDENNINSKENERKIEDAKEKINGISQVMQIDYDELPDDVYNFSGLAELQHRKSKPNLRENEKLMRAKNRKLQKEAEKKEKKERKLKKHQKHNLAKEENHKNIVEELFEEKKSGQSVRIEKDSNTDQENITEKLKQEAIAQEKKLQEQKEQEQKLQESKLKELKLQEEKLKEQQRIQEEKEKEQKLQEEKAKEEKLKEEQRLQQEREQEKKLQEERENNLKIQEQKLKEQQKLQEEKEQELRLQEQRLKEKQRLQEEKEEKMLQEAKSQEEQKMKQEKEHHVIKFQRVKPQESQLINAQVKVDSQKEKIQEEIPQEIKNENNKIPELENEKEKLNKDKKSQAKHQKVIEQTDQDIEEPKKGLIQKIINWCDSSKRFAFMAMLFLGVITQISYLAASREDNLYGLRLIIMTAIAMLLAVSVLNIKSKILISILSIIAVYMPAYNDTFIVGDNAIMYSFSVVLTLFSLNLVFVKKNKILSSVIAAAMFAIGYKIFQNCFQVFLIISIIRIIEDIFNRKEKIRDFLFHCVAVCLIISLGFFI